MGCGLCIVCAGSSLFGCAAANLLLDGSCVCGKVGDSIAILTAGGLEVHLHDEEAENEVHHHDLHQTHQHIQRPAGATDTGRQVQHQKINDAVGGADPDAHKVNDHLEQTVQNRVHQPQRRGCKQEGELQRLGHAHQTGGKGSRDDLCLGGGLLLLFGGGDKSHCHADHAEGLH